MNIFIVCFGDIETSPLAEVLRRDAVVEVETKDGGRAHSRIMKLVPDIVLLDGDAKPSHVIQTLKALAGAQRLSPTRFMIVASPQNAGRYRTIKNDRVELLLPEQVTSMLDDIIRRA